MINLPVFCHLSILSWLHPIHLQDIEVQRYQNNLNVNRQFSTTGLVYLYNAFNVISKHKCKNKLDCFGYEMD